MDAVIVSADHYRAAEIPLVMTDPGQLLIAASPLTEEDVRAFAANRLARQKIPRYVQIIDRFPMTVTGKVRKVELRQMALLAIAPAESHGEPTTSS